MTRNKYGLLQYNRDCEFNNRAQVTVELGETLSFEVQLDGLPFIKLANRYNYQYFRKQSGHDIRGYEVVLKFRSLNITNNGVFYTDSNGLEMQRRVIIG